jgi:hypothetical protein
MSTPREFWDPIPIVEIPTSLAKLRDLVPDRSAKRAPKWSFRLAPDLVIQIQAMLESLKEPS